MKLHPLVVDRVIRLCDLYGGRKDNNALREEIGKLDLTSYTQKDNPQGQTFLVLTEDVKKAKAQKK